MPLLEAGSDGITRVQESVIPEAPSDILAYRTSFQVNQTPVVVIVSEDLGALKRSQGELHAWTAIVSLLLITLLVAVIWFGINLSMKPVTPIKAALKRLQEGEDSRIDVEAPEEFQPLVLQLNQLLDSLDQRLERSREAVANLSHSVKTPIAAVRQILEDDTRPLDSQLRHQMASRLDDINKQLESEMRRSQFAGPQVGKFAHPIDQARDLLWLMGRLYPGKSFELSSSLPEETRWPIEEHDLSEVLGNLLDNAGKWSKQCVELELKQANGTRQVIVTDDGPGVKENEITQLGQRGLRLDQQMPGHGLGLAIVEDIVSRYSGKTHFVTAANGGLRVIVEL
jgi:signal transduction histidine kinase